MGGFWFTFFSVLLKIFLFSFAIYGFVNFVNIYELYKFAPLVVLYSALTIFNEFISTMIYVDSVKD